MEIKKYIDVFAEADKHPQAKQFYKEARMKINSGIIDYFIEWLYNQPSFEFQKQYFNSNQTKGVLGKFIEDEYPDDRKEHPVFIEFMLYPDIKSSSISIYFCSNFGDDQDYLIVSSKFKGIFAKSIYTNKDYQSLFNIPIKNQTVFDKLLSTNLSEYKPLIEEFLKVFGETND